MLSYKGNISPTGCWNELQKHPSGQLIDVRTRPEWAFVGIPDLSGLNREPVLHEWQKYPEMSVDDSFTTTVADELERRGAGRDDPLFFLCRSGVRSLAAAQAMTAMGYRACYNITGGFEGDRDDNRHRGTVNGWKLEGLPWTQG